MFFDLVKEAAALPRVLGILLHEEKRRIANLSQKRSGRDCILYYSLRQICCCSFKTHSRTHFLKKFNGRAIIGIQVGFEARASRRRVLRKLAKFTSVAFVIRLGPLRIC